MGRIRNLWALLGLVLFAVSICDFHVSADVIPSENECRPYIEKAIHELKNVEAAGSDDSESTETKDPINEIDSEQDTNESIENEAVQEMRNENDDDDSNEEKLAEEQDDDGLTQEIQTENIAPLEEVAQSDLENDSKEEESIEDDAYDKSTSHNDANESNETQTAEDVDSKEQTDNEDSEEETQNNVSSSEKTENNDSNENLSEESRESEIVAEEADYSSEIRNNDHSVEPSETAEQVDEDSKEDSSETDNENPQAESLENAENQTAEDDIESKEAETTEVNDENSKENDDEADFQENETNEDLAEESSRSKRSILDSPETEQSNEHDNQQSGNESQENAESQENVESQENSNESQENDVESQENDVESQENAAKSQENAAESQENAAESQENSNSLHENSTESAIESQEQLTESADETNDVSSEAADQIQEPIDEEFAEEESPEEDLTMEFEIPKNLRPRSHVNFLLGLDAESSIKENALKRTGEVVLKELKRVFDNAIKPLESMYKYRDLSNRHFGDPEIFSKPLILFMGPWSGGKSTILNYLTDNEYTANSIRSGAEPSPAYFNILMHGDEPEVLDGTQLAADWTFSGLQKFGQGLMDRLRGQKLPSKLLERVNIVEIPGILEVRKQVSRYFPFNDACQWFIDRADIIFLVYDPSKLDVGPETEAILDQLKGREYQTRILLNKADQVKPEELLRVQGALIWNISPLMSSAQPPVMYTVSLWSHPFENGAPIRLLQAQERAFLADLREAIDKRIENKIASARRFAVRIRNHAKMVDCYLTTYYNQKGLFSNKKQVSDKIIEHPQNYNIYEGLSTLTNISRYDLPDPEVYLDFFRLNPLYEFKKLSETCTYFKGCPINKLDIAIAYDLPELVGKYKKQLEQNLRKEYDENCNQTEPEPPVKIITTR